MLYSFNSKFSAILHDIWELGSLGYDNQLVALSVCRLVLSFVQLPAVSEKQLAERHQNAL